MAVGSKRRSTFSPSPEAVIPPKRRYSSRRPVKAAAPSVAPSVPSSISVPFVDRVARPKRWRKSVSKSFEEADQAVLRSIYAPSPESVLSHHSDSRHQPQGNIELRFSFTKSKHEDRPASKTSRRNVFAEQALSATGRPDKVLNQSFSNLSFDAASKVAATTSRTQTVTNGRPPTIPELTKPGKKREGYGFSFTDTMFYDSDEYPDTEISWASETERDPGLGEESTPTSITTTMTAIAHDSSFDDVVVVRDVGSFYMARPQRRLPCTIATREDTMQVKNAAKKLIKYDESTFIYEQLVKRLERMVYSSVQKSDSGDRLTAASATECALRLQDFLIRSKADRIDTGEVRLLVEHEIKWATWLVEASRTGVMHLKVPGCKCRPEWEEE